jgi:hypothetical protein
MATLWAKHFNTHMVRWNRKIKYDRWSGQPHSDESLQEAEKQACFYQYFVPHCPAYLTYNLNLLNELANQTLVCKHSLAFDNSEEKVYLNKMVESTPIGSMIDLPGPPTATNVEIFPISLMTVSKYFLTNTQSVPNGDMDPSLTKEPL